MTADILTNIHNKLTTFSKGQRRIATYILESYDKAAFLTAGALGKITQVSESTVVRFAAELGYDGYPAMLHQGERVLTAQEARRAQRKNGSGLSVTITGPVTVRQNSDIEAIAVRLADEIEARALVYGG